MTPRVRFLLVTLIVILAAFLRLFRFETFLEFLDDQGRDAITIQHILVKHDLTLLGPGTSVGKMYLGPLYYYAMVPFLALTYPEPTGPALAMAFLGIATVFLLYRWGKELVGERAALIAVALYATAPVVIKLARFSWQPNPAPFFGLLMMVSTYRAIRTQKARYWVVVAVCFAVLTQLHYVALLSLLPAGLLFIVDLVRQLRRPGVYVKFVGILLAGIGILFVSALPLIAFDVRHDHLIRDGFAEFLTSQQRGMSLGSRALHFIEDLHGRSMYATVELLGGSKEWRRQNTIVVWAFVLLTVLAIKSRMKEKKDVSGSLVVVLWFVLSLFGLTVYRDTIYPHYFAFLFPTVFLLFGLVLEYCTRKLKFGPWIVGAIVLGVMTYHLTLLPLWNETPYGIGDVRKVARTILSSLDANEKYNIALLNDNREYRGMKYRYYLEASEKPPQSQYSYDNLDKLVVIVENGEDPLKSPVFEIQQFMQQHPKRTLMTQESYRGIVTIYVFEK